MHQTTVTSTLTERNRPAEPAQKEDTIPFVSFRPAHIDAERHFEAVISQLRQARQSRPFRLNRGLKQ